MCMRGCVCDGELPVYCIQHEDSNVIILCHDDPLPNHTSRLRDRVIKKKDVFTRYTM